MPVIPYRRAEINAAALLPDAAISGPESARILFFKKARSFVVILTEMCYHDKL
jgi:hypothetical protein